jgi:hypothetical protein
LSQVRSPYSSKLLLIAILLLLSSPSFSIETTDPIRNGGGARALGMGRAVTAVLNDMNSAYFNPAGIVGMRSAQFTGMYYTKVYGNYHYFLSSGGAPTPYGVFGAGFISTGTGQFPITQNGTDLAYAEYADNLVFLSYGDAMNHISPNLNNVYYGLNLKYFSKGTSGAIAYSATGVNLDLGIKYLYSKQLSIGVNKQNIMGGQITWSSGDNEDYPSPLFVGVALKSEKGTETYSFDGEFPSSPFQPSLYHLGAAAQWDDYLMFRLGLEQAHDTNVNRVIWNPAVGVGIILKGITIDYTYHVFYEDPGYDSHFISLSYIGEYETSVKARAGEEGKIAYAENEEIPVSVRSPFEADTVTVVAPNQGDVVMSYDLGSNSWIGKWKVPQGFRSSTYNFQALVIDLEGRQDSVKTNDIFIKEGVIINTVEVIATPEGLITPEMTEKEADKRILEHLLGYAFVLQALPTRADMAKILSLSQDYTIPANSLEVISLFKDIDSATHEAEYISAVYVNKAIIGFTDKTFRPDKNVKYADLIAMMSDSEPLKENRQAMWTYLDKINKGKIANYDDMLDAFAASHYLDHKMYMITTGQITGGQPYIVK